ncbi:MAG: hypothetical protein QM727_08270 [Niabella sp.]
MTLVIANRTAKEVSFSADSRITFGSAGYFDKGIKLFSVPFKLKGPAKSKEDFGKYEFEHNYGIAVVGSTTNAFTVKDSIVEILPNVTYLTNMSDVSIIGVGWFVFKAYKEISEELSQVLREGGLCEILLGGYCLVKRKVRVVRFFPIIHTDRIEFKFEEILQSEGEMLFYGSGKYIAQEIYDADKTLEPLQILKKVIESGREPTVGGPMQSGSIYDKDFKISGVLEQEVNNEGQILNSTRYRRAFLVKDEMKEATQPPYLGFSYGYKQVKIKR